MHGWCAEKENRGKGGSGKGKMGAGVVSCQSMDPVGTQSGPSRAPILAFLGTAFGPSGSSRDPVGIQSGSSRDPVGHQFSNFWHHVWTCREAAKITQKRAKTLQKCYFLRAKSGAQKC